jgi:hypothetical protein
VRNIVFRAAIRSSGPHSSTSEIDGNRADPVVPPAQLRDELGWMNSIENVYYYWHRFTCSRRDAKYSEVVAVDEQTPDAYAGIVQVSERLVAACGQDPTPPRGGHFSPENLKSFAAASSCSL